MVSSVRGVCVSSIGSFGANSTSEDNSSKQGTLKGLTSREVHNTEHVNITEPIDLTGSKLREIGFDKPVAQLQRGVVRLRVEVNGVTVWAGSGVVISGDGLILSVNHVPAVGQKTGSANPFEFLPGLQVLKNLKTWNELLGQPGDVKLLADFPLFPKSEPPDTIFTPKPELSGVEIKFKDSCGATAYGRTDNTIEVLTVPVQILAESPAEDLMLARVTVPNQKDPFHHIKITDTVPGEGDFVYSIGHPLGIKHNALALGEVLDPNFDVKKIEEVLKAHGIVAAGISNIFGGVGPRGNGLSDLARTVSLVFAGIDAEPLVKFLNGAVVSTNRIDHGSSGGLLCNENGEVVGITYLGLLLPLNGGIIQKYAAGTLRFHPRHLPLEAVTGSVGMKKAIPFLETYGVNVTRIRDGEPSGVEGIEERAARRKARAAMTDLLKKQNVPDNEIPDRLRAAGIPDDEPASNSEAKPPDDNGPSYFIKCGNYSTVYKSKPREVTKFQIELDDSGETAKLVFNIDLRTESEAVIKIENFSVNPAEFNIEHDVDPDTRQVLISHLTSNIDIAFRLKELQERAAAINSERDTGFPKEPPGTADFTTI